MIPLIERPPPLDIWINMHIKGNDQSMLSTAARTISSSSSIGVVVLM